MKADWARIISYGAPSTLQYLHITKFDVYFEQKKYLFVVFLRVGRFQAKPGPPPNLAFLSPSPSFHVIKFQFSTGGEII